MAVKWGAISRLHAFPRAEDHLQQKTTSGAFVTLLGLATIILLFVHELGFYLSTYTDYKMEVDSAARDQRLSIVINITFPGLPCPVLSLDALDMSGLHEVDLHTTIFKVRLDREGRHLGKELIRDLVEGEHKEAHERPHKPAGTEEDQQFQGMALFQERMAESENEVKAIRAALDAHEGCNVHGHMLVQRVAGNFHFSVHGHSFYVLQKVFSQVGQVNVSHAIHELGFGREYPGQFNPLDGFNRILDGSHSKHGGTFKYFLKVVPTTYNHLDGENIATNQYSVTEYFTPIYPGDGNLPAVYFLYDLSPITVEITERRRNFFHFITRLCAVLGGTFALTGVLDRWIYGLMQSVSKAQQAGRGGSGSGAPSPSDAVVRSSALRSPAGSVRTRGGLMQ